MRIAILGGTFNPPHIGHLILIEELLVRRDFQEVLVIPANIPPHKTVQEDPGPQMRLALLDASIQGWPHVVIEDCELKGLVLRILLTLSNSYGIRRDLMRNQRS